MTVDLSSTGLAKLQRLADEATAGPWDASGWHYGNAATESYGVWCGEPNPAAPAPPVCKTSRRGQGYSDAAFIAAAREAVPALVAELVRLRAEHDQQATLDLAGITRRWSRYGGMGNSRGPEDYTDAGCRLLLETAWRDLDAVLAALVPVQHPTEATP